ncbi:MAG: hypothetical protein LBG06_09885 [Deltaproteobacteria bacterium]|nr:hypothetical protein [Deltaproteobacteria bacterium]
MDPAYKAILFGLGLAAFFSVLRLVQHIWLDPPDARKGYTPRPPVRLPRPPRRHPRRPS